MTRAEPLPADRRDGTVRDALRSLEKSPDAAVVHAADELVDNRTISAAVWDELSRHFAEEQRRDLVFTIGGYCLSAMAVNAFGVQKETT